jgi:hypothetical protein
MAFDPAKARSKIEINIEKMKPMVVPMLFFLFIVKEGTAVLKKLKSYVN